MATRLSTRSTIDRTSNPTARFSRSAHRRRPPPIRSSRTRNRKRPTRRNRTSGPPTGTGFDVDRRVATHRRRFRRPAATVTGTGTAGRLRRTRTGPWATPGRAAGRGAQRLVQRETSTGCVGRGRRYTRTTTGTPGCRRATGCREAAPAAWPPGRKARAAGTGTPGRTVTATAAVPVGRPARRRQPRRPRTRTAGRRRRLRHRSPACSGHRLPSCCCPRPGAGGA